MDMLLARLCIAAEKEKLASWSCQLDRLDKVDVWNDIAFEGHSAEDCKAAWNHISKKVHCSLDFILCGRMKLELVKYT